MNFLSSNIKQSFIQSGGTGINSVLGLLFYLLIARSLGISGFGYFSFLSGFALLASELGDLGFGSALIKFGSGQKLPAIFTLAVLERLFVAIALLIIFFGTSTLFDQSLLLSAFVAVSLLFASLMTQSLLARQAYISSVLSNLLGNVTRLVLTFLLIQNGQFSPIIALCVFSLGAVITASFGFISLKQVFKPNLFDFTGAREILGEVYKFNRYIAASFSLSSLAAKLDIPILYAIAGPVAVGAYSGAQKISSIIPQIIASLETVFSPKMSRGTSPKENFHDYLKLSSMTAVLLLLFIPFAAPAIDLVFGNKYQNSVLPFQIFLLGLSLFSLSGPFTSVVLYRYGKSNYHFFGSSLQLLIGLSLFVMLIPKFAAAGAAATFVAVQSFNLIYYLFVWKYVNHRS